MKYVLGIDLGTSGTKTVLFDQYGTAVCSALVEYPLYQRKKTRCTSRTTAGQSRSRRTGIMRRWTPSAAC